MTAGRRRTERQLKQSPRQQWTTERHPCNAIKHVDWVGINVRLNNRHWLPQRTRLIRLTGQTTLIMTGRQLRSDYGRLSSPQIYSLIFFPFPYFPPPSARSLLRATDLRSCASPQLSLNQIPNTARSLSKLNLMYKQKNDLVIRGSYLQISNACFWHTETTDMTITRIKKQA